MTWVHVIAWVIVSYFGLAMGCVVLYIALAPVPLPEPNPNSIVNMDADEARQSLENTRRARVHSEQVQDGHVPPLPATFIHINPSASSSVPLPLCAQRAAGELAFLPHIRAFEDCQ